MSGSATQRDEAPAAPDTRVAECGWWVWGEPPCVCGLPAGHRKKHRCRCGASWKGLGFPPSEESP